MMKETIPRSGTRPKQPKKWRFMIISETPTGIISNHSTFRTLASFGSPLMLVGGLLTLAGR